MKLKKVQVVVPVKCLRVDLLQVVKRPEVDKYLYILHDRDESEPHFHYILELHKRVSSLEIARWFGLPNEFYITRSGELLDYIGYLIHIGQDNSPYTIDDIKSNFDVKDFIKNKLKK